VVRLLAWTWGDGLFSCDDQCSSVRGEAPPGGGPARKLNASLRGWPGVGGRGGWCCLGGRGDPAGIESERLACVSDELHGASDLLTATCSRRWQMAQRWLRDCLTHSPGDGAGCRLGPCQLRNT